MLNKVTFKTVVSLLSFKFLFQDSFIFFILLSFPSCVISLWAPFCQGVLVLFFFSLLQFLFISSFLSLSGIPECQRDRPTPLSPFLSEVFPQKLHYFGVSGVRSHLHTVLFQLCIYALRSLSSLLLFSSLLLHFVPVQTKQAALTLPANGHGQRVREFVCQKIVCGG